MKATASLRGRLLLLAAAFLSLALLAAGLSIGFILHRFVRGQIDGRLDDRIETLAADLVAGRGTGPDGLAATAGDRDGPGFDRPHSGWYWQVRRGDAVRASASLDGGRIRIETARPPMVGEGAVPGDGTGPWGEPLVVRIRAVRDPEAGAPPAVIAATAPAAALRGPVLEALRTLALCLAVIGLFLFSGVLLQVRLGLRPLNRLRDDLAAVRGGRRARLPVEQPAEIRPLATEMNALLDQNAANLDHARAHVANLAHGLKTPLATLSMALAERGNDPDGHLTRLTDDMDRRIRHHLRRARAAAISGPARARVGLAGHVGDLRAAMLRIHAGKAIAWQAAVAPDIAVACDPQDLDEMLGNLLENACQWCRSRVRIAADAAGAEIRMSIEDDGPGLDAAARAAVTQRGRRLDESVPGHGFGLPIAMELAELYGGSLRLGRSELGGLDVRLTLPR